MASSDDDQRVEDAVRPRNQRDVMANRQGRGPRPLGSSQASSANGGGGGGPIHARSVRAAQLCASLCATWADRARREHAPLAAALAADLHALLAVSAHAPPAALLQATTPVLQALEEAGAAAAAARTAPAAAVAPAPHSSGAGNAALPGATADTSADAALASTSTPAPTPAPASRGPFVPPPNLQYLLLRLLQVQVRRLPEYFRVAWERAAAAAGTGALAPLPADLGVDAFLALMGRVRAVCTRLVDVRVGSAAGSDSAPDSSTATTTASGGAWDGWDGAIAARAFHIEILSWFHAPPAPTPSDDTTATGTTAMSDFVFDRVETLLRSEPFVTQLRRYPDLKDALSHLAALMQADQSSDRAERSSHLAMSLLCAWRPLPAPTAAPTPVAAPGATVPQLSLIMPHDPSFVVRAAPPSFAQHDALMSFFALVVAPLAHQPSHHQVCAELVQRVRDECEGQFRACMAGTSQSSASASAAPVAARAPAPEQCLHPIFVLLGVLQSLDHEDDGEHASSAPAIERDSDLFEGVRAARAALRRMLAAVLLLPEVHAMACAQGDSDSTAAGMTGAPHWPCTNALNSACPSCLFVWLASAAAMYAARYLVPSAALRRSDSDDAPVSFGPNLVHTRTACWLVMRAFLQLIDCTWILKGAVQPAPNNHAHDPATPPPTPAVAKDAKKSASPAMATAALATASAPALPVAAAATIATKAKDPAPDRSRSVQLLAWTRSPLYLLLPHYSRSLSLLLVGVALHDRAAEAALIGTLWRRVKYVHVVWRWYALRVAPRAPGARTAAAVVSALRRAVAAPPVTDANSAAKAHQRIRKIATMQVTNNPVPLPNDAASTAGDSSSPSTAGAPASSSPNFSPLILAANAPLNAVLLSRSHGSMMMSVAMLLCGVVKNEAWRAHLASPPPPPPSPPSAPATAPTSAVDPLPRPVALQAYTLAAMLDTLSLLEYARSDNFAPYAEFMGVALAMATGKDVDAVLPRQQRPASAPGSSQGSSASATGAGAPPSSASTTTPSSRDWVLQAERAQRASLYRTEFARCVMRMYLRCFFQPRLNDDDDEEGQEQGGAMVLGERLPPWLGMESHIDLAARFQTQWSHAPTAPASMLAQSGGGGHNSAFPAVWSHPSLRVPDPWAAPWPALCRALRVRDESSFQAEDLVYASRLFFQTGLLRGCVSVVEWTAQWHLLLPFTFALVSHPQKAVNARVQELLCAVLHSGYVEATHGVAHVETHRADSTAAGAALVGPHLPPALSGAALEAYIRSLLPYYCSTLLSLYPRVVSARSLVDSYASLFGTLPPTDLLLLSLLRGVRDRAAQLLQALLDDRQALARWRQVTDLLKEEEEASEDGEDESGEESGREEEEKEGSGASSQPLTPPSSSTRASSSPSVPPALPSSSAPAWLHRAPRNVRVPTQFPRDSMSSTRSLLLLYLQLMQSLDVALFPRALALLDELLERTLDPARAPVATPLRAAVAQLIHQTLVRGFDLYKRDEAVRWYIDTVRRLNIPIGIKAPAPPPTQARFSREGERRLSKLEEMEKMSRTAAAASAALRRA